MRAVTSVLSDSLRPYGPQPVRLLCPRDSAGKNTGLGCHFLPWGFSLTQGSNPGLLLCNIIGRSYLDMLSVLEQQTDNGRTIAIGIKTGTLAQWQLFFHCLLLQDRQDAQTRWSSKQLWMNKYNDGKKLWWGKSIKQLTHFTDVKHVCQVL